MFKLGIIWDPRYTRPERHTGVGKHILQVTDRLLARPDLSCVFLCALDQTKEVKATAARMGWTAPIRTLNAPLHLLKWRIRSAGRSALAGLDAVYSPQELYLSTGRTPMICTLHGFPCFQESLPRSMYHGWRFRLGRLYQKRLLQKISRSRAHVFSVSRALSEEAVHRFGMEENRLVCVGNGVEPEFLARPAAPRPDESAPLAQIGGINAFDGAAALCDIWPALEKSGYALHVVGDRHESPYMEMMSTFASVTFHGFLQGETLRGVLSKAKALLYLPQAESFGITGLEALALGIPVIAHRVGGLPETLGDCAFWVDHPDAASVRAALSRIAGLSDAEYQALQERGRARAASFTWDRVADRVAEGLKTCV